MNIQDSDKAGKVGAVEVDDEIEVVSETQPSPQNTQTETQETQIEVTPTEVEVENKATLTSELTTDYIGKRITAYRQNSLDIEDTLEVIMEYILSMAAKDTAGIQKYEPILVDIFQRRQSIKQQFPKV